MKARKRIVLRKQARYPQPPEVVWVALTDRRALAEWLMPNDFEPVVGHKFRFQYDAMPGAGNGITLCEVLEVEPPRRLSYTWQNGFKNGRYCDPSIVTWTLERDGAGTLLTLEHAGLETVPLLWRLMMKSGWGTMIKRWIPKVLANTGAGGSFTPGAIPLDKRCYKCRTIPAHLTR